MFYIPPGERESVVRWDALTESFIRDFPLIIVKLEVFSVPDSVMRVSYSSGSSRDRKKWLKFMEEQGGHQKVIVSVVSEDIHDGPREGDWVFLEPDGNEVDVQSSKNYKDVLAKMSKTGRQNLVALGDEFSKRRGIASLLDGNAQEGATGKAEASDT